jgi:hypothetical protein
MTDTIEEIRARHEVAQNDGRYDLSWYEDYGLTAHYDRATLLRALDEAQEELSIWQSVFPDIAPDRVLPDRSKLEAELVAIRDAATTALGCLDDPTGGDHVNDMRRASDVLRAALEETGQ